MIREGKSRLYIFDCIAEDPRENIFNAIMNCLLNEILFRKLTKLFSKVVKITKVYKMIRR